MPEKILMISHGHPDHLAGGGEVAAYNLHRKLKSTKEFRSVFFARHNKKELMHGGTVFSGNGKPDEVLFYSRMPDCFRFSQPDKSRVWQDFQEILSLYEPDIVHFHHYLHLGLEFIRQVKNHCSGIPVVLTLHEYFGICHNRGQMVKTHNKSLCSRSSFTDCVACFPEYSTQDFFLREQFIKSHFALVDRFIAPSQFLADRYIEWGLAENQICVIENALADTYAAVNQIAESTNERVKIGFYGQINSFKGVDLLLEALDLIPECARQNLLIDINGSGFDKQPTKLRRKLTERIERHRAIVKLTGEYHQSELSTLMSSTDWVVVPSLWWENSPVVILEARRHGVPVLCSNIGGMAEKVQHNITGRHFINGRAQSLAEQLTWIVNNRDRQVEFSSNMAASYIADDSLNQHKLLYSQLLDARMTNTDPRIACSGSIEDRAA